MYFNDSYIMLDTHKKRAFKRRFKDTCINDMVYSLIGRKAHQNHQYLYLIPYLSNCKV